MPIYRLSNLAVFLVCSVLIGIAYYMQYVLYLTPCPLCMVQRIAVMLIGLWCFIAFVHNPSRRGRMVYPIVLMVLSLLGIVFAGRHVWLQHLPSDRIPECFPGLEFILANHPFTQALKIISEERENVPKLNGLCLNQHTGLDADYVYRNCSCSRRSNDQIKTICLNPCGK